VAADAQSKRAVPSAILRTFTLPSLLDACRCQGGGIWTRLLAAWPRAQCVARLRFWCSLSDKHNRGCSPRVWLRQLSLLAGVTRLVLVRKHAGVRLHVRGFSHAEAVGLASVACGAVFAASSSAQAERALTAWGFVAPSHSLSDSTRPRLTRRGQWAAIMCVHTNSSSQPADTFYRCFTASAMLITVRLLSPDPAWRSFPAACPATLPEGCSRSSARAPHGFAPPLLPLVLRAKATSVAAAVRGWSASSDAPTRGTFLLEGSHPPALLHFRFVSRLWGFADDFIVDLSACGDGTRVQAHSQLRLGYGDMGVNAARIQALWRHLETAFDSAERSCET